MVGEGHEAASPEYVLCGVDATGLVTGTGAKAANIFHDISHEWTEQRIMLLAAHVVIGYAVFRPYKQLPENLSRKGVVPIRGLTHSATEDFSIFVVLYCGDPLYAHPQAALFR
jgi:hypothetical protein